MSIPNACPDAQCLQSLLLGRLSAAAAEPLERHLAGCSRCAQTLHGLQKQDTLTDALRGAGVAGAPEEVAPPALLARLEALPRAVMGDSATAGDASASGPTGHWGDTASPVPPPDPTREGYFYLSPPRAPGELGRLGGLRVLRELGSGGMGVVFEAEDVKLGRRVALKAMRPALAMNPGARERFLREARAAAAVESDHIAAIHQVGEENGVPFLVMPLLRGESLEDRLRRETRLPVAEAARVGREAALGLAAAHEAGLIHRDVKPGNLWLEAPNGRVKLLDFGLARAATAAGDAPLTHAGAIVGTPAYMAPEQAKGEKLDARCDLFSLGCVLYRAATGEVPFKGVDLMSTLLALTTQRPRPPRELNPALPPALANLLLRLLARDPADRPATARQAADAFLAIEREAAAPTLTRPAAAPRRRRRLPLAAAAVLLALLAGAAYWLVPALIRVQTDRGTLIVQVDDPDVEVLVRQNGATVIDHKKDRQYDLKAADGDVEFYDASSGVRLATKHFTLEHGGRAVVDARVEIAQAREMPKADAAPPPLALPADRENPFVVMRGDGRREEFKTFGAAAAVLAAGDAVEVDGNGPFAVPHMQLTKGLTLRAGAGYRPRLVGVEEPGLEGRAWIEILGGPLALEGCDFVPPDGTDAAFSTGGNLTLADFGPSTDPWTLRGCRFFSRNPKVFMYGGPEFRAEDCLISQATGHGFYAIGLVGANGRLDLSNCVVQSTNVGAVSCGYGQRLRLRNNTIIVTGFAVVLDTFRPQTDGPVTVEATGNLIQGGAFATNNFLGGLEALKPFVRWQGRDNLYARVGRHMLVANAEMIQDLAAWNKFWGRDEPGSEETDRAHFRCEALRWQGPADGLAVVRERADALRAGADVGPHWDFVGPGDAYLRALQRDGRAPPRDRKRPDPLEGGPFVLIRQGKAVRGYLRLHDATDAAGTDDVIEVRGDGPFEGADVAGEAKRLTLRAALGYQPVIEGPVAFWDGAALVVEGLHFRKGGLIGAYGGTFAGRLVRLAHCSFDADAPIKAIFPTTDGRPAEVTGCVVAAVLEPHIEAGDRLAIRDSVINALTPAWAKAAGTMELDHCLVWTTRYAESEASIRSDERGFGPKGLTVVCERTLLESDCFLLMSDLAAWRGSHNLFAVAAWDFEQRAGGLAEWQKRWGGDADSTAADPLGHDPREWALLPNSPYYRARPDGKDYGADVDRIARP